jgi:hypothetical protein
MVKLIIDGWHFRKCIRLFLRAVFIIRIIPAFIEYFHTFWLKRRSWLRRCFNNFQFFFTNNGYDLLFSDFFFFAWNWSKWMIKFFNFINSLRILHNHYHSLILQTSGSCLRTKSTRHCKPSNHCKLPHRHNMQLYMIIMPSKDSLLFVDLQSYLP